MSDLFSEQLGEFVSEQRRKRELARRRQDFTRRLQSRKLTAPPKDKGGSLLDKVTPDILDTAVGQIASTIKGTPRGLYEMVHQPVLDVKDLVTEGDITPERTLGMGKTAVEQIYQDVRHPLRNPGYLFLDALSLLPTPAAGVFRGLRATKAFGAVKRGEHYIQDRSPLTHGRKPPKEGGEGGAIEHPEGRVNPDEPDLPGPMGAEVAGRRYTDLEDVKADIVPLPKRGKHGTQMVTRPFDETGTHYALHRSPRGEFTILRYPEGKGELQEQFGDIIMEPKKAVQALMQAQIEEANKVGRFAPEPPPDRRARERENFDPEQNRKLIAEQERKQVVTDEAPKPFAESSHPERMEAARQWVLNTPDGKLNHNKLRELGIDDVATRRRILADLLDAGVITKAGVARKQALVEKQKLEATGYAGGTKVVERGEVSPEELDVLFHPKLSDDIDPDANLDEIADRIEAGDYDPVEIRVDDQGERFIAKGMQTIMAAQHRGLENLRYEELEVPKAAAPALEAKPLPEAGVKGEPVVGKPLPEDELPELALQEAVEAQRAQTKAAKAMSDKEVQEIVNAMPTLGGLHPTDKQIQRRLKTLGHTVPIKKAQAMRAARIKAIGDPEKGKYVDVSTKKKPQAPPEVPRERVARTPKEEFTAAQRLVFEEGATAATIAKRMKVTPAKAKKLLTAVNKDRAAKGTRLLTPNEKRLAVDKVLSSWGEKTPTVAQVMAATGLTKVHATRVRKEAIAKRETRGADPTGYKARTEAAKTATFQAAKAEGRTATREEIASVSHKTKAEDKKAMAEINKLAKATPGKVPTLADISRATGYGYDSAKRIQKEWADANDVTLKPRATTPSTREQGLNPRKLGISPKQLEAAGVPVQFQKSIRDRIKAEFVHAGDDGPSEKALSQAFELTLGPEAGKEAYGRWKQISGAGRPGTTGEALKAAWKEFLRPNRGGSAAIALVTRSRKTGKPIQMVDKETGDVIAPKFQMVDKGDMPTIETMQLIQRKGIERLPVEVALSNNVAIKKFQEHRYKWMAKEQSTRVERAYARMIRAGNVGEDSQALRHLEYQLRNLDRAAEAIEKGRLVPLSEASFKRALKVEGTRQQYAEARDASKKARSELRGGPSKAASLVDTVNQMAIIATLYMKPAYIAPNLLGQGFLLMADHYMNPLNVMRSMRMRNAVMGRNGPADVKRFRMMVKKVMGEGIIGSIEVKGGGLSSKVAGTHHATSYLYSKLLDNWFREMSFINEAYRHGFDTPEKIMSLASPSKQGKLIEVGRRANKNIIDFGDMSKTEREVFRRFIFFYPWMKASSLYTARFPTQHPFQAVAIGSQAREGNEKTLKELGPLPSYLEGSFKAPDITIPGLGNIGERTMPDGSKQPRIINPASASIFSSLGEVMDAMRGNFFGPVRESEQASDFLSPAISLASAAIFRRDPFTGREYPPDMSLPEIMKQEATQYIAFADAYSDVKEAGKRASGEKPSDEILFPYTPGERVGRFLGGITPYTLNTKEARSRALAEQRGGLAKSKGEQLKYTEKREELLRNAKKVGLLPKSATQLPPDLRDAMLLRGRREANLAAYKEEIGRELKNVDRLYADLNLLVRMKKMPEAAAKQILEQVKDLPDNMVDAVARQIRETHFSGAIVSAWTKAINARLEAAGMEAVG